MQTFTRREMAYRLNCSEKTITNDANHLNLKPVKSDRGTKLYDERDFNLISQLREHCADKSNSRESFVPNTEIEIVEEEPKITKLSHQKSSNDLYFQSIEYGLAQDPLFDLELLQRIADRQWLLSAKKLAPILHISVGYLNSLDKYSFGSFLCSKELYDKRGALWSVTRRKLVE